MNTTKDKNTGRSCLELDSLFVPPASSFQAV